MTDAGLSALGIQRWTRVWDDGEKTAIKGYTWLSATSLPNCPSEPLETQKTDSVVHSIPHLLHPSLLGWCLSRPSDSKRRLYAIPPTSVESCCDFLLTGIFLPSCIQEWNKLSCFSNWIWTSGSTCGVHRGEREMMGEGADRGRSGRDKGEHRALTHTDQGPPRSHQGCLAHKSAAFIFRPFYLTRS